jgi:hypothetical protein
MSAITIDNYLDLKDPWRADLAGTRYDALVDD